MNNCENTSRNKNLYFLLYWQDYVKSGCALAGFYRIQKTMPGDQKRTPCPLYHGSTFFSALLSILLGNLHIELSNILGDHCPVFMNTVCEHIRIAQYCAWCASCDLSIHYGPEQKNTQNEQPSDQSLSHECAVRANERTDEQVSQYSNLYSWLFWPIVSSFNDHNSLS